MNRFIILVLTFAVLFTAGCGIFRGGDQGQSQFEWEYLFEENGGTTPQNQDAMGTGRRISAAYRLQFDDTVTISLLGVREFRDQIQARVDENGEITLPYIENIRAEGLTSAELASIIRETYIEKEIYRNLNVQVVIPDQNSFYIRGEVRRPGMFPWRPGITLSQAISSAAGVTEYASNRVYLTRRGTVETFDLREIERDPSKDVLLEPDDQIRVRRSIF